jgi:hypothetical protein
MIPHNPAMIIKMAANMAKPVAQGLYCCPCAAAPDVACVVSHRCARPLPRANGAG